MCTISVRSLSLVVGWIHLISSAIVAVGLLIYLGVYNNTTYKNTEVQEELELIGLHTLLLLFLFSVASMAVDIMLLKGIIQERIKLMSPFVYWNYIVLGVLLFSAVITFFADLITGVSFGDVMIHLALSGLSFAITLVFFWPVRLLYNRMRDYPDQPEQHRLKEGIPAHKQNYVESDDV